MIENISLNIFTINIPFVFKTYIIIPTCDLFWGVNENWANIANHLYIRETTMLTIDYKSYQAIYLKYFISYLYNNGVTCFQTVIQNTPTFSLCRGVE